MLGIVYFGGKITDEADTALKLATSSGTVVGQLSFGLIADVFGRKRIVRTATSSVTANSPADLSSGVREPS